MLTEFKTNITIQKIISEAKKVEIEKDNYTLSYPTFINYFKDLNIINQQNFLIGINFTYGWMPTVFKLKSCEFSQILEILNLVKNNHKLSIDQLEILKYCLNNSIIGTSKLLHFINPNLYAIWDSNIYQYLTLKTPHYYRVDDTKLYLDYLDFCEFICSKSEYGAIHNSIVEKLNYEVTQFRSLELIMFNTQKSTKS